MSDAESDLQAISHDLFATRRAKLEALRREGKDPYRQNWEVSHSSREALKIFEREEGNPDSGATELSLAGRITAFRLMGRASFIKLLDRNGSLQVYVAEQAVGQESYRDFKKYDLGDFVGVRGTLFRTQTGEITLRATALRLLSKALRPLPEKWHGLANDDQIFRQRYLDLIADPQSRERAIRRTEMIRLIRQFLWARDFREVETPVLQNIAGGAAARPFRTHMNALDCDFYLRIAPELYLKRLLVAGFDRVFEIGRVFRNEGLSRKHHPEFTMLELYQAYSDHRGMMELIRALIQHLSQELLGRTRLIRPDGTEIELGGPWRELSYRELVRQSTGDPQWFSREREEKLRFCTENGIELSGQEEDFEITQAVYGKRVEPSLLQPTFVTQLPRELCPLAKLNQEDPTVLDVFELCINGQEIAPAYSEQNDPLLQRQLFEAQVGEETQNLDQDFLRALEHGMPPAGGLGLGIDRLAALLTGAESLRDVILFPSLRPLGHSG
ncbi:MAG: lysine--tRNA ligase [Puniceicoccales bacterium]|jgi:lysyl-tRNA synthetase class 2|nr:lysine--tRNA ligase [Puniceicoccales bacterium]